ncbi:MAG: glycosyltransferase family 9 protein [Chthoniobacterales bacterium]
MNRILVIRGGAIGDFILTLPAIKLLRENFPRAHLEILGYKHIVALAEQRFYAQAVRSIEYGRLASFFARDAELPPDLADYFHGFDLIVSYLFDPDQIFERNLRRCGVDNFLAGSPKIGAHEHAARQLARPLEELDLSLGEAGAQLFPSSADRAFGRDFLSTNESEIIALHPGSGSPTKNWPVENWLELACWLIESRPADSLLIVGGEADRETLASVRRVLPATVRFAENLSLTELAAVLEQCALFLGHDSGISHLAAAVGAPCILLFGPTDPAVWAPLGKNVQVIRSPNETLAEISGARVQRAVDYELMRIGIKT